MNDCLTYTHSVQAPEGLFCGLVAPLLSGGASVECPSTKNLMKCLKLSSPTKLFCSSNTASALLLKLLHIKRLPQKALATSIFPVRSADPSYLLLKRLSYPRVLYSLGGRLRSVITTEPMSDISSRAFFSFGIFAISMMSEKGLVPSMFHYTGDPSAVWRLPLGARADLCFVRSGGVGRVIIHSPSVREGAFISDTYLPLQKRSSSSMVTSLSGFVLKNGNIFVVNE